MVEPTTLATLVVAALASMFMAWTIGAGSSGSTPFAPAVGANAISVMRAGFVVGVLGFLGAALQGANVSEAVGGELVVFGSGGGLSPVAAVVALVTAAALVAAGIYYEYPIATAFTVTGAVVGAGLAMGGGPAWGKYREIAALWVAVPFVGSGLAYATARTLRAKRVPEAVAVPTLAAAVGVVVANVEFILLAPGDEAASVATAAATGIPVDPLVGRVAVSALVAVAVGCALALDVRRDEAAGQRHFLLALGGLVAFSAGGSQVGLAVGPLLPLLGPDSVEVPLQYVLIGGGAGLLVGSWTGAPRMIKTLSQDYSSLGPRRSIAALIPSFLIAQTAVFVGVPVSFNEIIVSAIVGSGYAASDSAGAGISREKMLKTVGAWVASLLLAFVVGYGGFLAVDLVV
jgi:PiT family inorganic phosphate transporter